MSRWDEIRKLAADLQRIQLGESAKKLSDHNCIEVVGKLIEFGFVDIVCSIDGKEYVTKQHLITQIKNECLANKGRVSLVELQQILGIEYQQIEDRAAEVVRTDSDFIISVGQLISREYLNNICNDVNIRLSEDGKLALSQITKSYDLPSDLLQNEIYNALGKTIHGFADKDDPTILYTIDFVRQQKALVRGALSALTKVTPVNRLVSDCNLQPSLFFTCFDQLVSEGQLQGTISGGRHVDRAVYIPELYNKLLRAFAEDFYRQNGYLEYSALRKLGIQNITCFLAEVVPSSDLDGLIQLYSGAIGPRVWTEIESAVEEAMTRFYWVDVGSVLPSEFTSDSDVTTATEKLHKDNNEWFCCSDTLLYKQELTVQYNKLLEPPLADKIALNAPNFVKIMKELQNNRDVAPIESTKKRSAKKKGKKGPAEPEPTQSQPVTLEFMTENEIIASIQNEGKLRECPEEILKEIAEKLRPQLNGKYREKLESVFLSSQADANAQQKRSHSEFQEQFRSLYQNIYLFDTAIESFDDNIGSQLRQFLCRTLCTDAANMALCFVSGTPNPDQMTQKVRDSTIKELQSAEARDVFQQLFAATVGKKDDLNDFFSTVDQLASPNVCSLSLKIPDKKSRSDLLQRYKVELERQLDECLEPAAGLLLSLLLIIARNKQIAVHASGKFVPNLVAFVQSSIPRELLALISETQQLVISSFKKPTANGENSELNGKFQSLKSAVLMPESN